MQEPPNSPQQPPSGPYSNNQPPYGQPQPPYQGQPPYGQQPYGQPPYQGQSPYGQQPPYQGQQPYQAPYQQPGVYQQPGMYQQPVAAQPKRGGRGCLIAIGAVLLLGIIGFVALFIVAANTPVSIKNAEMAKGFDNSSLKATSVGNTFKPTDTPLHCVINLSAPDATTKVKTSWYLVESADFESQKIKDIEYTTAKHENVLDLYLSSEKPWPVGKYKVEVYLNDVLDRTLEFNVTSGSI
jgi:hypothetical protein